ncbi:hypothetical protein BDY19DRAFT_175233 [Irpex rosettiformis]|uniref:Uncharacterized protein n=1 Tax=Irpex rosettiformis TaxID=378272 RepID=A0ACB8U2N0_9APHY|nr:hypothetical protein BDY19DRAFT_175233 [Irpex rosettiformis]
MQFLSVALLAISGLGSFAEAAKKCKCIPGDPCFPSQATWNAFGRTLSRPLISNQLPFASVCYNTSSNFNPSQCDAVRREEFDASTLASLPNTVQLINFEELAVNGTVLACPSDPAPGDVCHQGRVPSYAINVTTVTDIQKTITFASKYNLHLVVKNTGHELLGRSFGMGSVELFTHNMKKIQFFDSFVPEKAPRGTPAQFAVTIQPGVNWLELYTAADQHGRLVAGGYSVGGTVGAGGGWPIGGGHSILSPYYGLGADNILQFTVVLPDASHVTANAYENPDLFFALRGGGGPSFGVVTSLTYKTHPSIPFTGAFYTATANSSESFLELMTLWIQHHNGLSDAGWGGVWPFTTDTLFLTLTAQGSPPTSPTAQSALNSFFNESANLAGVNVSLAITVPYKSYQEFFIDNLVDTSLGHGLNYSSFHVSGTRVHSASWLMPRTLTSPGNATILAKAITTAIPSGAPFMVGGGVAANVSTDAAAIAPAFRRTISDMTIICPFNETKSASDVQAAKEACHQQILPVRSLSPPQADGGQYLNEADLLEEDWQLAQWGTNYPRLLSIKKKIDPHDLFIVYHGVNSEGWDSESVCKST